MSAELLRVCGVEEVAPGGQLQVRVPEVGTLAVWHVDDQFYVTADACTHMGASLAEEGVLEGHTVQCTWHNGKLDVRTGEVLGPPCPTALQTYAVQVVNGAVFIATEER